MTDTRQLEEIERRQVAQTCVKAIELGGLKLHKHQLCDLLDVLDKDQTQDFIFAAAAVRKALGNDEVCTASANIFHGLVYLKVCNVTDFEQFDMRNSESNSSLAE